ncbi:MAG: acetyl-CoA carboxylase biotin carboxylase subunit [Dehalococcoidia bacterium]
MFSKVLIANRGEIACRVIRTCKRLGIASVAVYSDADERALHVRMADEAVRIGPPPASESYLKADAIIKAAKRVKADAIHPGYGFLSENPRFVQAVEKAGIAFIGPSAQIIQQMGDKVMARKLAQEAGVPVIPGTEGEVSDADAPAVAEEIGFPLMIKAADGGGGMGIRIVREMEELPEALARARAQAQGAFGSSRMYIERRVEYASHVEVQIMGDKHGNAIHLFERDCSVQRRNQKVIEETPCAKLSPEVRAAITESAVQLAKSIGYSNAGTLEFLLDADRQHFYFLEMNTRLQVEHPITEMVTGVDLVELQLRSAAGEELPLRQEDVHLTGAAIEARIYPEDPETLMPTAGKVLSITEPLGDHIRIDGSLYVGYEVQPYYEPMMAKLIVKAADRDTAIAAMHYALRDYEVEGVVTNMPLIQRILAQPAFANAEYDTGFLERLLSEPQTGGKELIAAIALSLVLRQDQEARVMPSKWKMHSRRMTMVNRLSNGML